MKAIEEHLRKYERAQLEAIGRTLDDARVLAVAEMRSRTLASEDVNENKFTAYSGAYAKRKGSSHVNLRDTGAMLNAIDSERQGPLKAVILVRGDEDQKGRWHQYGTKKKGGGVRMPQRKWFGLSEKSVSRITELFRKSIGRAGAEMPGLSFREKVKIQL